ncbi:unnamed protein product [Staurois parvus]|uniref:Uncharacterized protein n=1 Tax=Staurois parvus TaxID=386267 RepID=A0ABN9BG51_9NEOB|nr:unnamed protein product [Staurois parvus]
MMGHYSSPTDTNDGTLFLPRWCHGGRNSAPSLVSVGEE